ncbi:hypothetical protein C8R44DRAFT_727065 [Mycena epipterygia]|nr:hypothetical protein C8R44DRAFT_727065 [Mycena epipterygia]
MMWQMSNTFATRFGPAPFSELVSEIQYRSHADRELIYFSAANFYGQNGVKLYSAFDDPTEYAGVPPSVQYLKALFTDYVTAHRIYIEWDIATLPLTIARADHTHEDMFKDVQQGLKDLNNPPTQLLYTDSPQSEHPFHESINVALTKDVEPVTNWSDLLSFSRTLDIAVASCSDSMTIEKLSSDILVDFASAQSSSQLYLLALAIKTEQKPGDPTSLHIIQLRTNDNIYIFKVPALTSRSHILPSLRAILTNPSIIKIGHSESHSIRQTLQIISEAFSLPEIETISKAENAPILELGKYAKLKGVIEDPSISFHALAGVVLQTSFSVPVFSANAWSGTISAEQTEFLLKEIDCQWQIYLSLHHRDSLGLPLQPIQAETDGQLVTLVQGCKPIAEGSIIGNHPGYLHAIMDDQNHTKKINVSASRSLIRISKVLAGALHSLHQQTMEWIFSHGSQAVFTTSQLHTRGEIPPIPSETLARAFSVPAPLTPSLDDVDFTLTYSQSSDQNYDTGTGSELEDDEYSQLAFEVQPDPMEGIEDELSGFNIDNSTPFDVAMEGIQHTFDILREAHEHQKLPTRVLDDAFHYMDRLLHLLSKKHSAFNAFAHNFSAAIFIRNKSDELAVRAVLEKHGVSWEYAKRAKAAALNRRIRRYIPSRHILVKRLEKLFDAYADIQCSTKKTRGAFFSDEANDPVGISLYYFMGKDRDGLCIYCTIRGTNSVEGGFHMAVRRIFGSSRASPELAECLLINWILCRNKKVGFHTGKKSRGHHAIWIRDEIVELAIAVGSKPSFTLPRVLSTRIATSETIGILPISTSLAEALNITTLPRPRITGATNQYRYLQLQQLVLSTVLPLHTHKEYITFKTHINHPNFRRRNTAPPHEAWKNVEFTKFAQFWNLLVDGQSRAITDSNQRLYYKLPQQLEAHHKKTILWSSERSTLADGLNFAARKPLLDLLNSDENYVNVLPAIPLPDGELDLSISGSIDSTSFDRMSALPVSPSNSAFIENESGNMDSITFNNTFQPPPLELQDVEMSPPKTVAQSAPPVQSAKYQLLLPGASPPTAEAESSKSGDRCAVYVKAYCVKRHKCPGKGVRKSCRCGHPALRPNEKFGAEMRPGRRVEAEQVESVTFNLLIFATSLLDLPEHPCTLTSNAPVNSDDEDSGSDDD